MTRYSLQIQSSLYRAISCFSCVGSELLYSLVPGLSHSYLWSQHCQASPAKKQQVSPERYIWSNTASSDFVLVGLYSFRINLCIQPEQCTLMCPAYLRFVFQDLLVLGLGASSVENSLFTFFFSLEWLAGNSSQDFRRCFQTCCSYWRRQSQMELRRSKGNAQLAGVFCSQLWWVVVREALCCWLVFESTFNAQQASMCVLKWTLVVCYQEFITGMSLSWHWEKQLLFMPKCAIIQLALSFLFALFQCSRTAAVPSSTAPVSSHTIGVIIFSQGVYTIGN